MSPHFDTKSTRSSYDKYLAPKWFETYSSPTSTYRTLRVPKSGAGGSSLVPFIVIVFVMIFVVIKAEICYDEDDSEEDITTMQSTTRRSNIEHCNLSPIQPQGLISDTPLRNSTVSIELQPSQNINSNLERVTTSDLPPAYDSVVQESGVIIIMQQQSLLSPNYETFMLRNNERPGADS
ncbi:unnamed protein product [Adineta steineri]|uniref:Transmembrane protein n=1 Tax=Adineta steineri TaxID=433720 RepID=A0A815FEG5_9BILA|nr:unnamed protein product [Adineta steineri]CAF4188965.1 unnamed protein product [Adineta steineri]